MTDKRQVHIKVPVLARVEGEGALEILIREQRIETLKLSIYEPPRLFEKFLEGRSYREVPDLVARICGICPVAYQMSAVHALEQAFGIDPGPHIRAWRRLFYCGEWIQSHALHIHLLAAPDFLGFDSVTGMAKLFPAEVRRGLRLQALGNSLIELLGARSVHPVGARVGGFHRLPGAAECAAMLEQLYAARDDAGALLDWVAGFALPADDQVFCSVALRYPDEYPMNAGRLVSSHGLDIDIEAFDRHFEEFQVPYSTALHANLHGQDYLVGPLARLNLNLGRLPPRVRQALDDTGITFPSHNMFHSIVARAVEILYAIEESIRLLEQAPETAVTAAPVIPRAGVGYGCTEAPRGVLWHRYEMDADGNVLSARIVPPTSQNQARIEHNLRNALQDFGLDKDEAVLRAHAEMVIRNYDPCISCATHFLKLKVDRQPS